MRRVLKMDATYSYLYDTHVLSITASHSEKIFCRYLGKKNCPISSSYAKVLAVLLKDLQVMFLEGQNQLGFKELGPRSGPDVGSGVRLAGPQVGGPRSGPMGGGSESETWPGPKVTAIL